MELIKKFMLTVFVNIIGLSTLQAATDTNSDEPITFEDLPQEAQIFIQDHFTNFTVTRATYDTQYMDRSYEVNLSDNTCLKFDEEGVWTCIKSLDATLSSHLVPEQITKYLHEHTTSAGICKMQKKEDNYTITLINKKKLIFDSDFKIINEDNNSFF